VCTQCHAHASEEAGSTRCDNCWCNPGFGYVVEGACEPCHPGTVKASTENAACSACPAMYFQDQSGRSACDSCGVASVPAPDHARCVCQPGHYEKDEANSLADCAPCPADTFQPAYNESSCTPCPPHKRSVRSTELEAECHCERGWREEESLGPCVSCAANKYKDYVSHGDFDDCAA